MPSIARPIRLQRALAALVLACHVLLLLGLARLPVARERSAALVQRPAVLWLLSDALPVQSVPPALPVLSTSPERQASPAPVRPSRPPQRVPNRPSTPAEQRPPAEQNPPQALSQQPPLPEPAAEAPASLPGLPQALNLSLPRAASSPWRRRNPATDDRRSNPPPVTLESRLAEVMGGDGRWAMQRLDNDLVRLRRGNTCVDVVRSRVEQLDGFNNSAQPKPWLSKPPQPC